MNGALTPCKFRYVIAAIALTLLAAPLAWPTTSAAQGGTPTPPRPLAPVVLDWTTKSEVNTAGFNLYRAERPDGPFTQINHELVPAANDPITGGHYVFTDTAALSSVTYYYQLEDVEFSGARTRHNTISITAGASAPTFLGPDATTVVYGVVGLGLIAGMGYFLWYIRRK